MAMPQTTRARGARRGDVPEIELLLACARRRMRPSDLESASRAVSNGIDWAFFLVVARAHALVPLAHAHASARAIEVPADVIDQLSARAHKIARRSLQLTSELLWLLRACARLGITVLPLKGPVLAERVYGSTGLRPFGDLDVLFHPHDIPAVSRLLIERGYEVETPGGCASLLMESNEHQIKARSRARGIEIELHYCLLTPRSGKPRTLATLEDRLTRVSFGATSVLALDAQDEVIYLCDHGSAHAWSRLEWLVAVAERLQDPAIDWPVLRARAKSAGAWRRVRAAVWLVRDLLCVPLDGIAAGPRVPFTFAMVDARLAGDPSRALATPWEAFAYAMATDAGVAARIRRVWMTFFVAAPYDRARLPQTASSLRRWFARPLGLLARWRPGSSTPPQ